MTQFWFKLAELTQEVDSLSAARKVLKEALVHTEMSSTDYSPLLLHLLGAELNIANAVEDSKASEDATATFQKVMLLGSGDALTVASTDEATNDNEEVSVQSSFGITTVEQACWQFLLHMMDRNSPSMNSLRLSSCPWAELTLKRRKVASRQEVEERENFIAKRRSSGAY